MTNLEFRNDIVVDLNFAYGSEHSIVNAARISLGKSKIKPLSDPINEKDKRFLKRLIRDYHGTPFEHGGFQFIIEAPLFVVHQLQRHRWSSFNEMSGRYTEFEPVFYKPKFFRKQSGKAMDYEFENLTGYQLEVAELDYESAIQHAMNKYNFLLQGEVAREHARMILPNSVYTAAVWTLNVRSLCNFILLRMDAHAQQEIQDIAKQAFTYLQEYFPNVANHYAEIAAIRPEFDLFDQ